MNRSAMVKQLCHVTYRMHELSFFLSIFGNVREFIKKEKEKSIVTNN